MAKSKNGGTRAYIRGRIGSDVYSVGKNGMGAKQQVVRSLAEMVSNPRTSAQMFNRMVMSTVMQAVSALKPIIDHSFDGFPKGQPSISEFIRRNYALVKADATAHPTGSNAKFGLNKYQEKGIKAGAYEISNGSVIVPAGISTVSGQLVIALGNGHMTVADLKAKLGLSADGYLTLVSVDIYGNVWYVRLTLANTLTDSTTITAQNVDQLFEEEGNIEAVYELDGYSVVIFANTDNAIATGGVIISEKENGAWVHSKCTLEVPDTISYAADEALPTYPTGSENFLNGGDI